MAEEKRFSHITVHADEDDEVVIQAGAVPGSAREGADADPDEDLAPVGGPMPEGADPDGAPTDDGERDGAPEQADPPRAASAARRASDDGGYRETTLEDLEGGKAPFAQKAVIVAALLLIVCFIVYEVAFA